MFAHAFVRNAYLAGTLIALACGTTGWFVVLRAQVFAADALSHVAFVGAIAAVVVGLDPRIGLFVFTLALAAGLTGLGRRGVVDDVPIGIAFAWILGIGVLLIEVLSGSSHGASGITAVSTLFGSIYALTGGASLLAAAIGLLVVVAVAILFRPLLLTTLDAELAELRGLPVRLLAGTFLAVLAVVTAEATQAVGALLLLGLIAAPAGAAHRLTADPLRGLLLAGGLAVLATWLGLAFSYLVPSVPPSTAIIAFAAASYVLATARRAVLRRRTVIGVP
jgi:zinc/manganese transport system permease protein